MSSYYTNCQCVGNRILFRGIEDGQRVSRSIPYAPSLFVPTHKTSKYKTLEGTFVDRIQQLDIKSAREFIRQYENVEGFTIYGNTSFEYCFISDEYRNVIEYDISQIVIANIDIETACENEFALPENPTEQVTAITIKVNNTFYVFGCGQFDTDNKNIKYFNCKDENDLLQKFLATWENINPDIVSGWNVQFFDIPYLVNRIIKIFGEKEAKRLSPWKYFTNRKVNFKGRFHDVIELVGISTLDYMELYRKFQPKQERDSLNYIAYVELGEKKLDYSEYGSLHLLYKQNFQKFIEYNIKDVELVSKIDEKLNLISMVIATAYDAKANFMDVLKQVRMWDAIVFNHLRQDNIVLPQKTTNAKDTKYPGAFVKEPLPGLHSWVCSFDLDSLYPHLIAQFNISPECLVADEYRKVVDVLPDNHVVCDDLLNKKVDLSTLLDKNLTMACNGHHFVKDKQGFFPNILMKMYDDRVEYKNKAKIAKKNLAAIKTEIKSGTSIKSKEELKKLEKQYAFEAAKYHNYQLAKKTQLNSAYGAMGNEFFRFFDIRLAEAVTISGQVVIQWIANDLNKYLNTVLKTNNRDYIIAIDTDSVYLNLENLVNTVYANKEKDMSKIADFLTKVCDEKIIEVINQSVKNFAKYTNAYAQKMKMKRENICDKCIWVKKKKYILSIVDDEDRIRHIPPKRKIMGLDAIKSNTPEFCRKAIRESIDIILDKDQEALYQHIESFKHKFFAAPVDEIACPTGANELDKYSDSATIYTKGCPMHIRAALLYNHMIKQKKLTKNYKAIKEGDKIRYVLLREPNISGSNVIGYASVLPPEFNLEKKIDLDLQFAKTFLSPLDGILKAINWNAERIATLDAIFG